MIMYYPDCPANLQMGTLPSFVSCHIQDYCTGIQCCVDVELIGKSLTIYAFLNACDYKLEIGIEKFNLNVTLLDYKWGKIEEFSLFGVLRIRSDYCYFALL